MFVVPLFTGALIFVLSAPLIYSACAKRLIAFDSGEPLLLAYVLINPLA